jgi:DNA-binding protein HU-beta
MSTNLKDLTDKEIMINELAKELEITKIAALNIINIYNDVLVRLIKGSQNHKYRIDKFGTFEIKRKEARKAKNPKTQKIVDVPAKNSISFKPSKTLKDSINE